MKFEWKFYLRTSFAKIFLFILVDGVYRRFQNRFLNSFLSIFCSPIKNLLFWKLVFLFALLKDNFVQFPAQVQYWSKDFCILISATAILLLGRHPKYKVEWGRILFIFKCQLEVFNRILWWFYLIEFSFYRFNHFIQFIPFFIFDHFLNRSEFSVWTLDQQYFFMLL